MFLVIIVVVVVVVDLSHLKTVFSKYRLLDLEISI